MALLWGGLALAVLIWAMSSKFGIVRTLARAVCGLIALAAVAAAIGLVMVGQKAHWTSDGPGMLLIMIGIPVFGIVAFFFGSLALIPYAPTTEGQRIDAPANEPSRTPREILELLLRR